MQSRIPVYPPTVYTELCPFVNFDHPRFDPKVRNCNSETRSDSFTKLGDNKASSDRVHRISSITLAIVLQNYTTFVSFSVQMLFA